LYLKQLGRRQIFKITVTNFSKNIAAVDLNSKGDPEAFKRILEEEHVFPGKYLYKFIAPRDKKEKLIELFPNEEIAIKESSKGNYISVTINSMVQDSNEVIGIYQKVHEIGDIISL
jgi:hypothetical protein